MNRRGYFFSPLVIIILILIGIALSVHTVEVNSIMSSSIRESGQMQKNRDLIRRETQKQRLNAKVTLYNCTRKNVYDCNESGHDEIIKCMEKEFEDPDIKGSYNTSMYIEVNINEIVKGSMKKDGSKGKIRINRNFLNVTNC